MTFTIRPTEAGESERVVGFLDRVFGWSLAPTELQKRSALFHWQYFAERPDWRGARSFVCMDGGDLVAHGGLAPTTVVAESGDVSAVHVIDWAGDRSRAGAGIVLFQELIRMGDCSFVGGASRAARLILPRIGFRSAGTLSTYMKSIRPFRELLTPPADWKTPLRFARNAKFYGRGRGASSSGWSAVKIDRFDDGLAHVLANRSRSFLPCKRTVALMDYLLACPAARITPYLLRNGGGVRGYFVISRIRKEARIIDIAIDSEAAADWISAYAAACSAAASETAVCRIMTYGSVPLLCEALRHCGFRILSSTSILLADRRKLLAPRLPWNYQMLEGDAAYL